METGGDAECERKREGGGIGMERAAKNEAQIGMMSAQKNCRQTESKQINKLNFQCIHYTVANDKFYTSHLVCLLSIIVV